MDQRTDIAVGLVCYAGLMLTMSLFWMRRVKRTADYLVGGRGLPYWALAGTITAGCIGTGVIIGASGLAYRHGWAGSAYPLGLGLGTIATGLIFAGARRFRFMTLSEEISCYYGNQPLVAGFCHVSLFLSQLCWLTVQITGSGRVLAAATGWNPEWCVGLAATMLAMIVIPGGFKTVVYTDFLNALILVSGFAFLFHEALKGSGGWGGLRHAVPADYTTFLGHASFGGLKIAGLILALSLSDVADPGRRLAMYSARNEPVARWSMATAGTVVTAFSVVIGVVGMYAFKVNPRLPLPDEALPWLVVHALPAWLGAIVVVASMSAIFSCANNNAAGVGSFFVRHIFPMATGRFPARPVMAARGATLAGFILAAALALRTTSIVDFVVRFLPVTTSGLAVIILIGHGWKRATWQGAAAALAVTPVVSLGVIFIPSQAKFWGYPAIPAVLAGAVAQVVVSLLTPRQQHRFDDVADALSLERRPIEEPEAVEKEKGVPAGAAKVLLPLVFLLVSGGAMSARAADPLPAGSGYARSLDGVWRFKLEQAPKPPHFPGTRGGPIPIVLPEAVEPFFRTDYVENGGWTNLAVPGNWEMAGLSPATYGQPDNASGFYRLWFLIPKDWQGRVVKLNFDGVQNGCEVWCNGQPVPVDEASDGRTNYHESGWTAWQADLTRAARFGESNLLALRVTKNTPSVDCDTGDFFFLGGVDRPVTLFCEPVCHFRDIAVRTTLLPGDAAQVEVLVQLTNAVAGTRVAMELEGEPRAEAAADADGRAVIRETVSHPRLWSAEFPNLYRLQVELAGAGGAAERWEHKIGIREVSITNGIFCVNHIPVKLAGICRHDVYPTLGTALNEAVWRKDLTLMKAANFNAVRTSHYPYGSGFYDLCDEMGFYVADEEPFCWVNCDDPKLTAAFAQRARETVERDKNHPCVVIWAVGNENKPGRDNALAAKITRQLDPTRPRLISCQRADEGTEPVEFDDAHYVTPRRIHRDETSPRRQQWPAIYLENPNVWDVRNGPDYGSLDLWRAVMTRTWDEIWPDDHVAGSFLWEWQDRAVADRSPVKYYYYFPKTGINLLKVKGVVDGFRDPRPEYYHIKMAQTPIALGSEAAVGTEAVSLAATNRYSFTDLSQLRTEWTLMRQGRAAARGTAHPALAPRMEGRVTIPLPAAALAGADTLRLEIEHPGGWNVVTYNFNLRPEPPPAPGRVSNLKLRFPDFHFVSGKNVDDGKTWMRAERQQGELSGITVRRQNGRTGNAGSAELAKMPLANVAVLDATVLLRPGTNRAGTLHAEYADGTLRYRFTAATNFHTVYELGWVFHLPKGTDRFAWDRKADWSWYPPGHIGRPHGEARPDSARVDLTRVDRPDAFDFDSTKFACNWAALTNHAGKGLLVRFEPEDREDVRAGIAADGATTLTVNRCESPPRDISAAIVPDLYTELKKGAVVRGEFQIGGKSSRP